jgi:hypothetical protein
MKKKFCIPSKYWLATFRNLHTSGIQISECWSISLLLLINYGRLILLIDHSSPAPGPNKVFSKYIKYNKKNIKYMKRVWWTIKKITLAKLNWLEHVK